MELDVEVVVDIVRLEEKLIINSLRNIGLDLVITNLKLKPLSWIDKAPYLSVIRPISMQKAVYSACIRNSMNVKTINNYTSIMIAGDKILTLSKLKEFRIPFPETYVAFSSTAVIKAGEEIGFPLVDKPPIGSWGRLITLVNDMQVLRSIIEHREMMLSQSTKTHMIQRYIKEGRRDIRVLTLGDEIVGAVTRTPNGGEWRSNVALGARMEPYKIDTDLEDIVHRTIKAVGGDFLAIDVFLEDGRYLVNEVNGVPEFKGFMNATKINVPELIAKYIKAEIKK
ncbi:MAG: lysine biosynthesis protein LysX [Aigarchaeota archaeon]|nr:lysine biosynthesis protein LysX [Aigarchaeota archaeon]MCX8192489.1 lysine biosynthesis protein LysX [Nitrososphaeria archaeon]MDW7985775.1 lysine biosynthesis protein LysX [Nitrososphaerota archaeon]